MLDKKGNVATKPFAIGPKLHLNRNDRTVSMHGRSYFLAGNSRGSAPRLSALAPPGLAVIVPVTCVP